MDEDWNYSMWVELYNAGESAENQNAYYFTDDLNQPEQWKPLSKIIPAKGFSVLWFERDTYRGHANFKLSPSGGTLYLMDENGKIADMATYPAQYRNVSYGRLTDGGSTWVFFPEYSTGASNNGKKYANTVCNAPQFAVAGGFYQGSVGLRFQPPPSGETIYYTVDGSEPDINSISYSSSQTVTLTKTTCVRAISMADNKIPSNIITTTYFVNERAFNLPVVSLVTEQKNLTDPMIGIYVAGSNGVIFRPGCTGGVPVNYGRDWQRPANFELFDADGRQVLSQELDIEINGACTRTHAQKSLKIKPRNKFGDNQLRYDFFPAQKPGLRYKDVLLRNSGNDWNASMMRDGFCQTLVANRMDLDHQAYEPAVCFINGVYYGIQNLREVHSKDFLYSNYGLKEEDIYMLKHTEIFTHPEYLKFSDFISENDVANPGIYEQVKGMIDIDSYVEYVLAEIYLVNTDWPQNNLVIWKNRNNGKWRYILMDCDFAFNRNQATNALNRLYESDISPYINFSRLMTNDVFRDKFIHKSCIHLSSTFAADRVKSILDKLSSRISVEIVYHKNRWGHAQNFDSEIANMREFAERRPDYMFQHIGQRFFQTAETQIINISSNIDRAKYYFFTEKINDQAIDLRYFKNQPVEITPAKVSGYQFIRWEYLAEGDNGVQILTAPVYQGILTKNISLTAIYEERETDAPPNIYINEISGNDKWLEIYNDEDESVDLTGYKIRKIDNEGIVTDWPVPAGTTIDANGFKTWTQNVGDGFTWGITAQRDVAFKIFDHKGREFDFFEVKMSDNLYSQGNNRTVGRRTDGAQDLVVFLNGGTKGGSNNAATVEKPAEGEGERIFINEISGNNKWLEIYNDEDRAIDISGYTIRKIDDVSAVTDWSIPAGTTIAPKGFRVWTQNVGDGFTWGITAQRDVAFKLFDNQWRELDFFEVKMPDNMYSQGNNRTVGRRTDGAPDLVVFLNDGTKGASNRQGIPDAYWISGDASLQNITLNHGELSPAFDAGHTEYNVNVANSVTSVSVTGVANHHNAKVTGNVVDKPLRVGENQVFISVVAENGRTSGMYTVTVIRANITGVEDTFAPEPHVYPNPFSCEAHILCADGCTLQVISVTGAVLHARKITDSNETVHLEHLPAGEYFFLLRKDGKTKTVKAVKE